MKGAASLLAVTAAGVAVTAGMALHSGAMANDLGTMGQTWSIAEPDLLSTIQARLGAMAANGGIAQLQRDLQAKAQARVRRPLPVAGLSPTTEFRRWSHDPSIMVEADVRDAAGRLIAARGTRVNPLDFVTLQQDIVFLDGDDPDQVAWAGARWAAAKAKIVLVSGSPYDLMAATHRRYFFDQRGALTAKFGITHVPAIVREAGKQLIVEEVVLPTARRS